MAILKDRPFKRKNNKKTELKSLNILNREYKSLKDKFEIKESRGGAVVRLWVSTPDVSGSTPIGGNFWEIIQKSKNNNRGINNHGPYEFALKEDSYSVTGASLRIQTIHLYPIKARD